MKKQQEELPLFTKTYDFLAWLIPQTHHFPRLHRYTVTRRLLEAALDFQEAILEANSTRNLARLAHLDSADAALGKVRLYLRLVHRWHWMSLGQYEHAARMIAEIGRMLGGWQKYTRQQTA